MEPTVPEWKLILVRYGEIGIKSRAVRERFEKRLMRNVEGALARRGVESQVTRQRGRVLVRAVDTQGALAAITRTFGVVSASVAEEMPPTLDAMRAAIVPAAREALKPGTSFAVRARRVGDHPFTSVEAGRELGSAAYEAAPAGDVRVDLGNPDVAFHFEVRPDVAYFYRHVVPGPGGLPVGTAGKIMAVVEDARGALATWLMMKRGTTPLVLVPEHKWDDVHAHLDTLADWGPVVRAARLPVPEDVAADPAQARAFALACGGFLAKRRRAHAVILGDGLTGAVATSHLDPRAEVPVFRPLTGFTGDALADLARQAGLPAVEEPDTLPALARVDPPREAVLHAVHRVRLQEVTPA